MHAGKTAQERLQRLRTKTPSFGLPKTSQAGKEAQSPFFLFPFNHFYSRRLDVRGEVLFSFGSLPAGYRSHLVSLLTSTASPVPVIEARGIIRQARLLLGEITEGENIARFPEAFLDFVKMHLHLMMQANESFKDVLAILDSDPPTSFR